MNITNIRKSFISTSTYYEKLWNECDLFLKAPTQVQQKVLFLFKTTDIILRCLPTQDG